MKPKSRPKDNSAKPNRNFHDYAKSKPQPKKSTRTKTKRGPLPMKLRALPRSFWQQPNRTAFASPGLICSRLPSIIREETLEGDAFLAAEEFKQPEFVSAANTELLFSLFEIVDGDQRRQRKVRARGRPRKSKRAKAKTIRDEDPYLTSNATEELLPLLPARSGVDGLQIEREQVVTMLTSESGEPGNDYSHILSQLVVQL